MRKGRAVADGLANGSYPPLCCPSRSVPVREEGAARTAFSAASAAGINCGLHGGDGDALAPVLRETHRKSPFVTMSFADSGYNGDEAQRAVFEASRISITVVQ